MTRDLLLQIAKEHKLTLSDYDEVYAYITPNYTKLVIEFCVNMGAGIYRDHFVRTRLVKSVRAINRKAANTGILAEDYVTPCGHTRIFDIPRA